ncbi:chemotaxis protein CheZ [Amphritea atlantica]|jgi:chemotaxis protein CheZ|uniref:Protein phosphatase CheZ n=1 Tax=Amphritea atlantica TaxID=355243 RepID=A0A1H9L788_9GAMM|nr:protein phosphatase CheZ [Amphritea atlantica]SER07342.1 chemotaxis protein CheZ [Amphritea atlantica]
MSDFDIYRDQHCFEAELQARAEQLVELLSRGELPQAMELVQQLNEMRHQALYHEVGTLTRAVHNAIVGFTEDVSSTELLQDSKQHIASITDASDRLSYVIELTESNAHKTIDEVDEALQQVSLIEKGFLRRQELIEELAALKDDHPALEALYDKACRYADDHSASLASLKERLTGILLAQEYQDITGQLIKRVIQLVADIEDKLVGLMEVAARVNNLGALPAAQHDPSETETEQTKGASEVTAEGPQMKGRNQGEVASSQDDVDDLLSSLGF